MKATADVNAYWLFDASALTTAEREALRDASAIRWLYDHIPAEQATSVSPVVVAPFDVADQLAAEIQSDEARAWAVASLHTHMDFTALARHLAALRYLHTKDGQRYYLRYADSRCLAALWAVLTAAQRRSLLGAVQRWAYIDRQGCHAAIHAQNEEAQRLAGHTANQLRLSDPQLGQLLHGTWPDQLLYSMAEQHPDVGLGLPAWQRYDCAQRVCQWLLAAQEDRYPVQLAMLKLVLSNTSPNSNEDPWSAALKACHEAALDACA